MLIWGKVAFFPSARWWADIGYWLHPQNHNRKCREKKGIGSIKESSHTPTKAMRKLQKGGRLFWISVYGRGAQQVVQELQPQKVKQVNPPITRVRRFLWPKHLVRIHSILVSIYTSLKLVSRCLLMLLMPGRAQCLWFPWGLQVQAAPVLSGTWAPIRKSDGSRQGSQVKSLCFIH